MWCRGESHGCRTVGFELSGQESETEIWLGVSCIALASRLVEAMESVLGCGGVRGGSSDAFDTRYDGGCDADGAHHDSNYESDADDRSCPRPRKIRRRRRRTWRQVGL